MTAAQLAALIVVAVLVGLCWWLKRMGDDKR
jgi:heme/copper-type cytochrome/quinol oxidase subunit 4